MKLAAQLVLKPKPLKIDDLPFIGNLGHVDDGRVFIERSPKGYKLKTRTDFPLANLLNVGQQGLAEFIVTSLTSQRPLLIPFVLENSSMIELAKYFLRARTGSLLGFYAYTNTISIYSRQLNSPPDQIIADIKGKPKDGQAVQIEDHQEFLENYLAQLQDHGRSSGRVYCFAKHVRTFYRVNGIDLHVRYLPRARVTNKDRAPQPEELQRILDMGDLRERVIVSLLALGGLREGTLVRLKYRHVKEDLERDVVPIHLHIESDITKGKYHDYDTFLGAEAAENLKLYIEKRTRGSPDGKIPPEEINDNSPLIRRHATQPETDRRETDLQLVHGLFHKAGLLKRNENGGYDLHVHSIRKYFKTQMMALGVPSDYVEYMMGHTVSVYHDVQSKGIEFLRNTYASAALSIKPRTRNTKIEMLKEVTRALGLEPEKILVKQALAEPHRSYVSSEEQENEEIRLLGQALRTSLKNELTSSKDTA